MLETRPVATTGITKPCSCSPNSKNIGPDKPTEPRAKATPQDVATPESVTAGSLHGGLSCAGAGASRLPPLVKKASSDKMDSCDAASTVSGKMTSRSVHSAASSVPSENIPGYQREVDRIQKLMKAFSKGMVKGREMNVLSVDGQLRACTCSFDRKLRNYKIVISRETRSIPLTRFREVFQGTEPEDIATPLDELCATLMLDSGECLSFRFEDVAERENFAMCLSIIVDSHQK